MLRHPSQATKKQKHILIVKQDVVGGVHGEEWSELVARLHFEFPLQTIRTCGDPDTATPTPLRAGGRAGAVCFVAAARAPAVCKPCTFVPLCRYDVAADAQRASHEAFHDTMQLFRDSKIVIA